MSEQEKFNELRKTVKEFYRDYHAIGTEHYWKSFISGKFVATDGVKDMRDKLQCQWLLDIIASYGPVFKDDYYSAYLFKTGSGAQFYITDEDDNVLVRQEIEFTDIEESVKLFIMLGEVNDKPVYVVLLPSEY